MTFSQKFFLFIATNGHVTLFIVSLLDKLYIHFCVLMACLAHSLLNGLSICLIHFKQCTSRFAFCHVGNTAFFIFDCTKITYLYWSLHRRGFLNECLLCLLFEYCLCFLLSSLLCSFIILTEFLLLVAPTNFVRADNNLTLLIVFYSVLMSYQCS